MLELRPSCENCDKALPNDSAEAMICTYECTFCKDCVNDILLNVCPNCGGGFENRPTRPKAELVKNPASNQQIHKPVKENSFLIENKSIDPRKR